MTMINIEIKSNGTVQRTGYRTFAEMVRMLERINKRYKKLGVSGDFMIRLPIRGWLQKKGKQ